jgi:hypothetical protein
MAGVIIIVNGSTGKRLISGSALPQQCLNRRPLPQGQGALRRVVSWETIQESYQPIGLRGQRQNHFGPKKKRPA